MKTRFKNWIMAIALAVLTGGALFGTANVQPVYACTDHLLTFPAWYRGLQDGACDIKPPTADNLSGFIWKIVLNIIEIMLQLAGYIAAGFILYGGYRYMIGYGKPDSLVSARKTIINAVVGLVITMASIGIVNVVAGAIK